MTPLTRSVSRLTLGPLGPGHGSLRERRLVATLAKGDLLELRPHRTRRPSLRHVVRLVDVYTWAIKCAANRAQLEKAREAKEEKARRLEQARLRRSARAANLRA